MNRDKAIEILETCELNPCVPEDREVVNMAISALSAQKTGHWVPVGFSGYADGAPVYEEWECSECHEEHYGNEDTLTDYCPHCGARMVCIGEDVEE